MSEMPAKMAEEADRASDRIELSKPQRQAAISELVLAAGTMRIEDLAEHFGVSSMTVHRDLDALEARGLLRKSRGVATAVATSLFEASTLYRVAENVAEKRAVARAAFEFVEPGQVLIMDDSTTGLYLAELLPERPPMTVITNFHGLIAPLSGHAGIRFICLGGEYFQWCDAFMGTVTSDTMSRLRADVVFLSTSAITDDSCFHHAEGTVQVKRAMFASAERRILYVDRSKFERRALHSLARLDQFDVVIVDDGVAPEHVERMQRAGIKVVVAATSPEDLEPISVDQLGPLTR